jgi:hypothetical protein
VSPLLLDHTQVTGMRLPGRATRSSSRLEANAANSSSSSSSSLLLAEPSLTRRMFEAVDARQSAGGQAGGAGGRTTYQALLAADQAWSNIRNMQVRV